MLGNPLVRDRAARWARAALFTCLCAAGLPRPALAQGFGGTVADILVRAESLLGQNRTNEAIVQFQEARTLCATPAEMVTSMQGEARALVTMKESLAAAGLLEEAATRYPDDPRLPDLLYLAGFARRQGGDIAGAAPLLERALASGPTPDLVPGIKFELARALRFTGKAEEVVTLLQDFETAHERHPMIPNALYTLAIAQHDAGRLADSEATYRHLVESYPHTQATLEALFELGQVLDERGGRRAEAAEFFRRYSNGAPNSPVAARAMERAGDLTFFSSPREAALYYGVAQVKAQTNPVPEAPALQVSRWLGTKKRIADALAQVWVVVLLAAVAAGIAGGVVVFVIRRARRHGTAPAGGTAGA